MSILSKEPDALGFYYGFLEGDHRQINVRDERFYCGWWLAYVGGTQLPQGFENKEAAEEAAIDWARANPEAT
jgi:hypothetical protein